MLAYTGSVAKRSAAIIGCGNISGIYAENLSASEEVELVAFADLDSSRAVEAAKRHGGRALTPHEVLADPSIEIVVNLTVPKAHYAVSMAALESGKHVYSEKPLAVELDHGRELVDTARLRGLLLGCAPDTFLGGSPQTCRKLIDEGAIGQPVGANCFMLCHGHESWHPAPEFYYQAGGGPMMDMGPYYLTALVFLFGPVARVSAMSRATFPTRRVTSAPNAGRVVAVETATHVAALLEFQNGAIGQITTSFDVWHSTLPPIELYGTEGSMLVPDPNGFGGVVKVRGSAEESWREVPIEFGHTENSRGLGVADLARALDEGRPPRASGELALHVLEVMHAALESGSSRRTVEVAARVNRPAPLVTVALRD